MKRVLVLASIFSLCTAVANAAEMVHETDKQDLTPPHSVEMYLDGFHNYKGEEKLAHHKQLQRRYAHYCKQISPDMFQCIIYDGNTKDARLIGTEHVITQKLYDTLSPSEKQYWHPHDGEVDSGMLRAPGMSPDKEKATLDFLKHTWGKTWNVWQPDLAMPTGPAKIMWAVHPQHINDKTKAEMAKRETNPMF